MLYGAWSKLDSDIIIIYHIYSYIINIVIPPSFRIHCDEYLNVSGKPHEWIDDHPLWWKRNAMVLTMADIDN